MNIKLKYFSISIIFVPLSFHLNAKTYYVSESGNDQFSGTKAKPFRTINRGAAMASLFKKAVKKLDPILQAKLELKQTGVG